MSSLQSLREPVRIGLESRPNRATVLYVTIIVAAAILPYVHSLPYPFVNWDDYVLITGNEYIKELSWENVGAMFTPGVVGAYQPLRNLSYAIDHLIWGMNPFGFRLTNLALYALTCILVFFLIDGFLKNRRLSLFGALLFALHPVHVEAVTWLSARKEVLSGLFYVLGFMAYVKSVSGGRAKLRYYSLSIGLFMLGALSKPTTVSFPVILFLFDFCFVTGGKWRAALGRLRWHAPFWLVAIALTAVTVAISARNEVLKSFHGGGFFENLLNAAIAFPKSIVLLILPIQLSPRYINYQYSLSSLFQLEPLVALACLALFIVLARDFWKRSQVLFFSLAWIAVTLLPVANLVPVSTLIADRYLYIPSVGFCLLVGGGLGRLLSSRPRGRLLRVSRVSVVVALTAGLVAFSYLTFAQNLIWRDTIALWSKAVEQDPRNFMAHSALGAAYLKSGNLDRAIRSFRECLSLNPYHTESRTALGQCYAMNGDLDRALFHLNIALRDTAAAREVHGDVALVLQAKGSYEDAIRHYRIALGTDTTAAWLRERMVECYAENKAFDAAIAEWKEFLKFSEDDIPARLHYNLGVLHHMKGEYAEAVASYRDALKADSSFAEAHFGLADAYMALGEAARAESGFLRTLVHDPIHVGALANLGNLYYEKKQYRKALSFYEKARSIEPRDPRVLNGLGLVYGAMGMKQEAIRAFSDAAETDTINVSILLNLGSARADAGQYDLAELQYRRVLELEPQNGIAYYNLSCIYALQGKNKPAIRNLTRALECGFSDYDLIRTDEDLSGLKSDSEFQAILKTLEERE